MLHQSAEPIKSSVGLERHQSTLYNRLITKLTVLLLSSFAILLLCDWLGLRINTTPSIAPGFYLTVNKTPEKGDLITFCLAQDHLSQMAYQRDYIGLGNCPGHYEQMIKLIVGVGGDNVSYTGQGIIVNGALVPYSKPLFQDGLNRPLSPQINKVVVLEQNELLVMTTRSPLSFDSRYFGPIRLAQVRDVVAPLWTWQ